MEKIYIQDIFYIKAHGKYTEIYIRDDREYVFPPNPYRTGRKNCRSLDLGSAIEAIW